MPVQFDQPRLNLGVGRVLAVYGRPCNRKRDTFDAVVDLITTDEDERPNEDGVESRSCTDHSERIENVGNWDRKV